MENKQTDSSIDNAINSESANSAFKSEKKAELEEKAVYGAGCFYELTKWLIAVVIFFCLIHFFVATVFIVDGVSMEPNFHTGETVIANRWQYIFGNPERGDVVVLKFPGDPVHKKYIKRIIGIPGDTIAIKDGEVFLNGKKLDEPYLPTEMLTMPNVNRTLRGSDYFLMGDNRPNSSDSRVWGIADKRFLIGKGWLIIWPFNQVGVIQHYTF
ncbi:TPA: signal peptidase I [Candidatus Berkelbacteria bacterium]|uniref:Signal peptidase I n=1 Tax=Berkelbacteria bacterium GW2011_GWE1_39_12 TaxID=1618337 RepID=A0A0G4B5N2_9BACT|nr:MAG: signal peptidase I, signal peptidase I [Berkelbacteria bacterium GW2011_GWE1_39_12]HBO60903.1 signal peptidase I [Candidatus Berkelbacteria bacterium]